jgi:adenine-specific DNA-methyltransferase
MTNSESKKTVETLTHEEARRRSIPTAGYQSVLQKGEQSPVPVAYGRGAAGL